MTDAASSYISETEVEEFTRIVRESRNVLIQNDTAMIRGMDDLLSRVASNMRQAIRDTPRGLLGTRFRNEAIANLERVQEEFRVEYQARLDGGILANAQLAVQREQEIQQALLRTRTGQTSEAFLDLIKERAGHTVQFGQVPREVLERLYARTYSDGLNLHNRLVVLQEDTRKAVSEAIFESVIAPIMEEKGISNTRYKAQRIARTETNLAYREGHIASATDENGELHPWISGIGWRLSPAHPRPDICDVWADDDSDGLGNGNYEPSNVPPGHPCCLCYTVSILASMPEQQFVSKRPDPEAVPKGQLEFYGVKTGDVEE